MKKFLLIAAAALALFGCREKIDTPEVKDSIDISVKERTIDDKGGDFKVLVTSSKAWTLTAAEEYDWVRPSATEGEDGDVVKFTVDPNTGDTDKTAKFNFAAGEDSKELTITSLCIPLMKLEAEKAEYIVDYNKGEIAVNIKTEVESYRDIKVNVAGEWLRYVVTLPGTDGFEASAKFSYEALSGLDDQEATVTFSAEGAQTCEVKITQEAKEVIEVEKEFFTIAVEGETFEVPVTTNVAYSLTVSEGVNDWFTAEKTETGVKVTAKALSGDKRAATVTLTQTDAKEGVEPIVRVLNFTQTPVLINWAANMTGNRLFPKWDGTADKLGVAHAITLETMLNVSEFHKEINTIMGIEGRFLLRFGDAGVPINKLQVATVNGNYPVDCEFETNRWYHIACTYEMNDSYKATVKVYVDGELKGEKTDWAMSVYVGWPTFGYVNGVDFSPAWSYEPDGTRCFWMGYSYDANRDLRGLMTEIRIWNKVLTAEEINAPDHFYTVDPKSEGLYAYWKFTEGDGNTIADATGNGNKLYGETNVRKQGSDNKGDDGIKWVSVALPDK